MAHDFQAWRRLFVLQWHNAASLRLSFLTQIIGMMINNGGITVAWVLFISVFGTVNGWGVADVIGAQGIGALTYGLAYSVCNGAIYLGEDIQRGKLDGYFLRPLRMLPLVWRSYFSEATFGDILFGVLMISVSCILSGAPGSVLALAVFLSIPGAMIMVAMSTITSCYSFWNPEDQMLSETAFRVFMTPSMYPAGAFPKVLRAIYTFIIPTLLVSGVPWEAAREHAPWIILGVWVAGFAWLGLAGLVFRAGLRRYESGGTG